MTTQKLKAIHLKGTQSHNSSPDCRHSVSSLPIEASSPVNTATQAVLDNTLLKVHPKSQGEGSSPSTPTSFRPEPFRRLRWAAMDFQRAYSPNKGQALCGLRPIENEVSQNVGLVKLKGQSSKFTNRMLCKSYWCPYCSEIFRAEKRDKIKRALNYSLKTDKKIYFITWTIPKAYGSTEDKFKALNGVIRQLWNRLRNKVKRDNNKLYTIKGLDLTINDDHPDPIHLHTHSIVILDRDIDGLSDWLWIRYKKLMDKVNCSVSELAFNFQRVETDKELDSYICKNWSNLDKELTSTDKVSKSTKSLGWFRWICKIQKKPTIRQIDIYQSFLKAAKGKRTLDLSRNFDELLVDTDQPEETENLSLSDDDDSPILELVIGKNLWRAITETRSEYIILGVIDSFYDLGLHNREFEFIMNLIEASGGGHQRDKVKKINFVDALRHLRYILKEPLPE